MKNPYTIGLDIGTNSVGWAVLTNQYDLVKRKMKVAGNSDKKQIKKNFWGVRLFDDGQTAVDRRMNRTARRRIERRRNRISYLQEIFAVEMANIDANFFCRLNDSFYVDGEKRNSRHPFFATIEEEVAYHDNYRTIYHLREELVNSSEKADLRLVYLALAHIIKYRGNFLIEGALDTKNTSVDEVYKQFIQTYNQAFMSNIEEGALAKVEENLEVASILAGKFTRREKIERILRLYPGEKSTGMFAQFISLIVGNKGNFQKVFNLVEKTDIECAKDSYEEDLEALLAIIGDEYAELFVAAKNTYNAVVLSSIITVTATETNAKLSASMIERFDAHEKDLGELKAFIKLHLPKQYQEIFNNAAIDGYAGYIDGKTKQVDFYKYLKTTLENVEGADYFITKIEEENFLRKQRTFDNGVIPHQLHLEELEAILHQQAKYYPFLREDYEKIKSLVTFRIPYFVGPLAKGQSEFAWLTRKADGEIRPWNIEEKVDFGKSAVDFIEKMTNKDTYLPKENVLPKHSLCYQKYMVYNELTKVRYIDDQGKTNYFSGQEKQQIFNDLFKQKRKVKKKDLELFLRNINQIESPTIEGLEDSFNASYATYHDLLKVGMKQESLDSPLNAEMLEDIVKILTVFEDKRMIKEQLQQFSDVLDGVVLKKLERRHYTGWGRLSAKLLVGIRDKQSHLTILDYLMNDDGLNRNLMQLINDSNLSFKSIIEKEQVSTTDKDLQSIVADLAGSPAIKKGILQSLKIVDELVSIMGYPPQTIVVEMARENQTTVKGKNNSRPRYKSLEKAIKDFGSQILKEHPTDNQELKNNRLYLYYLQNGKDIYTGQELDIHNLSNYDIDHIVPQSFITDNSIDNLVLTSSAGNREKGDDVPPLEIVRKRKVFWEKLYQGNLMSKRKFDYLTKAERGGLTEADKARFIHRQLVETRQITKNVANILHQRFNNETDNHGNTMEQVRIVTLKSALVSQFRKQFQLYKVREVNDYHHAHDAYLNGVVANTLLKVYPQLEPEFVYGEYHQFDWFKANKATAKKQFYTNIMLFFAQKERIIDENGEILWDKKYLETIKKVLDYRQMNIVKKTEIQKGEFSKATIKPKGNSSKLIPRKENWDPMKYGGLDSPNMAYAVIIEHAKGKKKIVIEKKLIQINIMERKMFEKDEEAFLEEKGYRHPKVLTKLPKYTLYECEKGRRRMLASANEAQKGNQLVLSNHLVSLLYHAKNCEASDGKSLKYIEAHRETFSELLAQVSEFATKYTLADANLSKINSLFEQNKEGDIKAIAQSFVDLMAFNAMGAPASFKFFEATIDRKRYTNLKELLSSTIIYQSITGLYESRKRLDD
ncbi:type II CRISPR RNA-guided endonuclease Cas9 [Listeria monocytogenes]|uniref:type II CRISPR RNA-guided endonuclease Cas9 n=1 Tax=Listeria monocytogenes TaxID=1639 RepID=UPI000F16A313|nr:type II CRISPR RNA-guided endonuclease Cas9 [Listeria monocytogenes]EJN4579478.1 type II CRISPR RNA-guided endonuclease Cas9 [Listeria monocytogenes]MDD88644.1 type II CRISPR RNA-guided endonuclease Cas9 [Listeria monocytogenes]